MAEKRGRGRPTAYKPEYADQARKLCELGATDVDLADFFEVSINTIANWRSEQQSFAQASAYRPNWREERAEKTRIRNAPRMAARRRRMAADPSARVRNATAARIWAALRGRSDGALFSRLGYSAEELVAHLERQFDTGMAWNNYGAWHIDHKRPCASFDLTDESQFRACWALENLQPLWASANIRKGARHASPEG